MIRTKICGIQRTEDAIIASEAGADFIGLNFVPERRRRIELAVAAEIVDELRALVPEPPSVAGLFADQPLEEVAIAANSCGMELVQLCGQESPDYCRQVAEKTGVGIIKVIHIPASESVDDGSSPGGIESRIKEYLKVDCLITLDRLVEGLQGGTGQSFNWDVAAYFSSRGYEFLLAGGLTPDNVSQAVKQVNPWGVDVSSGVETGGQKDAEKVRAFIKNARGCLP